MIDYFLQSPGAVKAVCRTFSAAVVYTKKGIAYTKKLLRIKMFHQVREEREDLAGIYLTTKREPIEERMENYRAYCEHVETHTEPPKNTEELRTFESQLEKRLETMK